jgi:SNF2 family DNA or RNA helicase
MLTTVSGFDHNLLTGEVDGARRQEMVDEFQNPDGNHYILLVSTVAGGTGLNLTAVRHRIKGRSDILGQQSCHFRSIME